MIKNFKRVIALSVIMLLILPSVIFAAGWDNEPVTHTIQGDTFSRNDGSNFIDIANVFDTADSSLQQLESEYNAKMIPPSSVEIYDYKTNNPKGCIGAYETFDAASHDAVDHPEKAFVNSGMYAMAAANGEGYQEGIAHFVFLPSEDGNKEEFSEIATVVYKDSITYNGKKYSLKMDINKVVKEKAEFNKDEEDAVIGAITVGVRYGFVDGAETNKADTSKYIATVSEDSYVQPYITVTEPNPSKERSAVEIDVDFTILDSNGNESSVSGLLAFSGFRRASGMIIDNYTVNNQNAYVHQRDTYDNLCYKVKNNKSFIFYKYVQIDDNQVDIHYPQSPNHQIRLKAENVSKFHVVHIGDGLAFGRICAFSTKGFTQNYQINTEVTGGTIDNTLTEIPAGESRTVHFAPTYADRQSLTGIIIDGEPIEINGDETEYTFNDINAYHTIEVEYSRPSEPKPNDGEGENGNENENGNGNENENGNGSENGSENGNENGSENGSGKENGDGKEEGTKEETEKNGTKTTTKDDNKNIIDKGSKGVNDAIKTADNDGKLEEVTKNAEKNANKGSKNVAPNLGPQAGGKSLLVIIAGVIAITVFLYKKSKKYKGIK